MVRTGPTWGKVMFKKSGEIGWQRLLSKTAVDLLLGLQAEMHWNREIRMRIGDMAAKLGVSRNSASSALGELINQNIIRRGELPASYFFTDEWIDPGPHDTNTNTAPSPTDT